MRTKGAKEDIMETVEELDEQIDALQFVIDILEKRYFDNSMTHKVTLIEMKLNLLRRKRYLTSQ